MGLESGTLIKDLNQANPAPGDNKSEGDDHIRLIKKVLKGQFPNLEAPVTQTAANLNKTYVEQYGSYMQLRGNSPIFEMHMPGRAAFMSFIGNDSRLYWSTSDGAAVGQSNLFSIGAEGRFDIYNQLSVSGMVSAPTARLLGTSTGGATMMLAQAGGSDRYLHRNGDLVGVLDTGFGWTWWSSNGGDMWAKGNITAFSDERYKKNWEALPEDTLEKFAAMDKVGNYDDLDTNFRRVGVSAQQLREVLPEAVTEFRGALGVVYGNAALVLVHELTKRLLALEAEVEELRGQQ